LLLDPRLLDRRRLARLESFLDFLRLGLLPEESLEVLSLSLSRWLELGLRRPFRLGALLSRLELERRLEFRFLSLTRVLADENDGCEEDEEEEWLLDFLLRGVLDFPRVSRMVLLLALFRLGLPRSSSDESSESS
jgi:hypothetical protein